jgi:hypothetical protein
MSHLVILSKVVISKVLTSKVFISIVVVSLKAIVISFLNIFAATVASLFLSIFLLFSEYYYY